MPRWNMEDVRQDLRGAVGRNLADLAQGAPPPQQPIYNLDPTSWWPNPPQQTPRIGMRGPMPDMLPGAWNAAGGRGGRKPHWNDPSGRPYSPGPRPGIDYDTRGSAPTFDDWLMNWSKRFGG